MHPKGLSQREIQRIVEFDRNASEDADDGDSGEEDDENIIEEDLENIQIMGRMESEMVSRLVDREIETEEASEIVFEKVNGKKLKWSNRKIKEF